MSDLPTALYITAVEIEGTKVFGQIEGSGTDEFGLLLAKDSPLTVRRHGVAIAVSRRRLGRPSSGLQVQGLDRCRSCSTQSARPGVDGSWSGPICRATSPSVARRLTVDHSCAVDRMWPRGPVSDRIVGPRCRVRGAAGSDARTTRARVRTSATGPWRASQRARSARPGVRRSALVLWSAAWRAGRGCGPRSSTAGCSATRSGPILRAFWLDVRIFLVCARRAILVFGLCVARWLAAHADRRCCSRCGCSRRSYTDIVRGVPVILWIYLIGFGVVGFINSRIVLRRLPVLGWVALVFTYSAYVAEVFRAGIESVHESQRAGARSLGLSTWQTNRHVVLPQAVRRVVPPLMNDFVSLQKDVALISLLGPIEALRRANVIKDRQVQLHAVRRWRPCCSSASRSRSRRLADHLMAKERTPDERDGSVR